MSLPSRAKKQAEATAALSPLVAWVAECKTARDCCGRIADDTEVSLDTRGEATMHRRSLELALGVEDMARPEVALGSAVRWSAQNI